jgi:RHS repeat-associated protein
VLEERTGSAVVQYIWSPIYVDALVLRDKDATGDGTFEERLYVQQDANFNVTALISSSGSVLERYVYDPFGQVTRLTASWGTPSSDPYAFAYLHQGGRWDSVVNLYHFRNRDFSPALGRWLQTDPVGYAAGDTSLYRYVGNNPGIWLDPSGLAGQTPDGKPFCVGEEGCTGVGVPDSNPWHKDGKPPSILDDVQSILDGCGILDPTPTCDAINAGIYIFRGKWADAAFSAAGMVPYIGDAAKLGRWGAKYGDEVFDAGKAVGKSLDGANGAGKGASKTLPPPSQKGLGGGCFAAGTRVLTPTGDKAIESLQRGDLVLAVPENNADWPVDAQVVEETFASRASLLHLHVAGHVIQTTSVHPFYVRNRGWVEAGSLRIGDELRGHDGRWLPMEELTDGELDVPVYNVRVAEYHTYFVGSRDGGWSVWAHNNDSCFQAIPPGSTGGKGAGQRIPPSLRDERLPKDKPTPKCVYCRKNDGSQLDHVTPRVDNGDLTPENIAPACPHCNASKGRRPAPVTPPADYNGAWPPKHWPAAMKKWWKNNYGS